MNGNTSEEDSASSTRTQGERAGEALKLSEAFRVRFWGVRGSYPVSGGASQQIGGNTACVEVQVGGQEIILDAGTGLIPLGQLFRERGQAAPPPTVTILFSHLHYDHILGLPFFDPLYQSGASLHLAGPRLAGKSIAETLGGAMTSPYFPVDLRDVPAHCQFYTLEPGDYFQWSAGDVQPRLQSGRLNGESRPLAGDDVRVTFLHTSAHPRDGCLISRVEYKNRSVVYATDVEWGRGDSQPLIHFAAGADLLIHDAQYTEEDYVGSKRGFGHSTPQMATKVARAAGVKRLLLFHHDPEYDDRALSAVQEAARQEFPETSLAFEGLEVSLSQTP